MIFSEQDSSLMLHQDTIHFSKKCSLDDSLIAKQNISPEFPLVQAHWLWRLLRPSSLRIKRQGGSSFKPKAGELDAKVHKSIELPAKISFYRGSFYSMNCFALIKTNASHLQSRLSCNTITIHRSQELIPLDFGFWDLSVQKIKSYRAVNKAWNMNEEGRSSSFGAIFTHVTA
jgi:hypothetical protein